MSSINDYYFCLPQKIVMIFQTIKLYKNIYPSVTIK